MLFEYIDENLKEVIENPQNVILIKPLANKNKMALYAIIKEKPGIYKKLQLTKEQYKMEFPFEPICHFYNGPGYLYLKQFLIFYNWIAVNITQLEGFRQTPLGKKNKQVGVYALFADGSATLVGIEKQKRFEKNGGIQKYTDLLTPYQESVLTHDDYKVIEYYDVKDDTFVIPELQNIVDKDFGT